MSAPIKWRCPPGLLPCRPVSRRSGIVVRLFLIFLLLVTVVPVASGQTEEPKMRIGAYERAPFAMREPNGSWSGLAVDLWEQIAESCRFEYEIVAVDAANPIAALAEGKIDVLLGEFSASPEDERLVDFSQPFLSEPLAAAFRRTTLLPHWGSLLAGLPQHGFFLVVVMMAVGLVVFSICLWWVESRRGGQHFSGRPLEGIGSALWFAAVTMTTVGYGDKTPSSPMGRALAFAWMFCGILLVSALTATVASTVTIWRVTSQVESVDDLVHHQLGVQRDSFAAAVLRNEGLSPELFGTPSDGLTAVKDERIDAFVADRATLRFLINSRQLSDVRVVQFETATCQFALAVRPGNPDLESVNVALLEIVSGRNWPATVQRWLGPTLDSTF